jgi:radical SAM superfamily enzyme YgiQ (UPF0313 family)
MKTLIIALNSKYIHTSLAPWYLKAGCGSDCGEIKVMEFTINDSLDSVLASIYNEKADFAAFSCYIWNIIHILKLAQSLKKIQQGLGIILGGPQVSYDSADILSQNEFIDYIISGEGELSFKKLLTYLSSKNPDLTGLGSIAGLNYRIRGNIASANPISQIQDLDSIPSPYTDEMLAAIGNRIVYFESSRGCPFSCTYCLSSTIYGVRYFSIDRVKLELSKLYKAGVRQVKFVDRTFNCHSGRAKEIFRFIIELYEQNKTHQHDMINFHFEAAADLFDEEMMLVLEKSPAGLMQFEIGVQTVNIHTLQAINRRTSLDKLFFNVRRLMDRGNIHIHMDLIAGLPFEDLESFKSSFNRVYGLEPHQLQLGFLKLLKGTEIRKEAQIHGYIFREYPPYEVLANKYISFSELTVLKGIEGLVDKYYNSGRFARTLIFIIESCFECAYDFYQGFYSYNMKKENINAPLALRELYSALYEYVSTITSAGNLFTASELMKLDFLASDRSGSLPGVLKRLTEDGFGDKCFDFLRDNSNVEFYLPGFIGISAKQIYKNVHFELINLDDKMKLNPEKPSVFLFNYGKRDRVTGLYHYHIVNLK